MLGLKPQLSSRIAKYRLREATGNYLTLLNTILSPLADMQIQGETVGKKVVFGTNYIRIDGATNPFTTGTLTISGCATTANNKSAAIVSVSGQYVYVAASTFTAAVETQGSITDGTNTLQIAVSPSAPQTLTSITSFDLFGSGKNILFYPYANTTKTLNGITFTNNGDGTVTLNGTASSASYFNFSVNGSPMSLKAGTYTISGGANSNVIVSVQKSGGGSVITSDAGSGSAFTITKSEDVIIYIYVTAGYTASNIIVYPQLEKASSKTAWEKYNGTKQTITLKDTSGNALEDRGLVSTYNTDGSAATYTAQDRVFRDVDLKYKLQPWINKRTLVSGDILQYNTGLTNIDIIYVNKPTDSSMYNNATRIIENSRAFRLTEYKPVANFTDNATNVYECYNRDNTTIGLTVPKGTYANTAAAAAALTGKVLLYALATAGTLIELHPDNQTALTAAAVSYKDITNISLSGIGQVYVKYRARK